MTCSSHTSEMPKFLAAHIAALREAEQLGWHLLVHGSRDSVAGQNQSKRKTSYANGQTNLGHKHKAPDHIHEATQPLVRMPHKRYHMPAVASSAGAWLLGLCPLSPPAMALTWSKLSNLFFIHLMATYLPFLMHWAFSTSENVPSPFLDTRRYSEYGGVNDAQLLI